MKSPKKLLPLILGLSFGFSFSSVQAARLVKATGIDGKTMDALPGQVLVRYKPGRTQKAQANVLNQFNVKAKHKIESLDVDVLPVPKNESIDSFIEKLKSNPDIEFAEPNGIFRANATAPNDPELSSQYYLSTTSTVGSIQAIPAWDFTVGATTVAVIDTGVFLTHQDISSNLWVNPSPSGLSGLHGTRMELDWDGNGNCNDTTTALCSEEDAGDDMCASNDPTDDNTCTRNSFHHHGTHVAGIVAASTNNGLNIAGICPNCRIMAVKVLNNRGAGTMASIVEGITYAVDNGASVINLSLGGSNGSSILQAAVNYAINNNVVLVAASGNAPFGIGPCAVDFPAAYPQVISVSATDNTDTVADYACTGPEVDLSAPGSNILSLTGDAPANQATSSGDGTSFASPMVAGVAALIRSLSPNMSVADVTRYLDFYSDDKGSTGFDNSYGFGRLNAFRTLQAASNLTPFVSNPASPGETFPYPNPFNPTLGQPVTISLPASLGSQNIEIKIFNLAGESIKTLIATNSWDGKNEDGNYVASGLYFYFAKTSQGNAKGKLTVLK